MLRAAVGYVLPIDAVHATDVDAVGAKAVGLAWLARQGVRVSAAVVVPADIPNGDAVREEIEVLLGRAGAFAVRSSAPAEGTPSSYAGMFTSYLDVRLEDVSTAIDACRASASNARRLAYEKGMAIKGAGSSMGVIIQRMVEVRVGGACCTVNPLTGDSREAVVEAAAGGAQDVMAGKITPDYYRVGPAGELLEFLPGDTNLSGYSVLENQELRDVLGSSRHLALKWGGPAELEFALEGDKLYFLQIRSFSAPSFGKAKLSA